MHAVILAFLLAASTVAPRLEEPLRLLAEVRDASGELVGAPYVARARNPRMRLVVWDLPPGVNARHSTYNRLLMVAPATLNEDPRVVATILVHELRHSLDLEEIRNGTLTPDCLTLEARGFGDQSIVARAFWPDELPSATPIERGIAAIVGVYEAGNVAAIREALEQDPQYQRACADRADASPRG